MPEWQRLRVRSRYEGPFITESRGRRSGASAGPRKITTRRICGACNSWMDETFEKPAKPIIERLLEGDRFVLSGTDQDVAAGWIWKTHLMQDLVLGSGQPRFPLEEFRYLREHGAPSKNVAVWIAHIEDPAVTSRSDKRPTVAANTWRPFDVPRKFDDLHPAGVSVVGFPPYVLRDCYQLINGSESLLTHSLCSVGRDVTTVPHPFEFAGSVDRVWPRRHEALPWPPPRSFRLVDVKAIEVCFLCQKSRQTAEGP